MAEAELFDQLDALAGDRARRRGLRALSIAIPTFAPLPAAGHGDRPVLGFVGFVRPWHGLDEVIEAMAAVTDLDAELVVAGRHRAAAACDAVCDPQRPGALRAAIRRLAGDARQCASHSASGRGRHARRHARDAAALPFRSRSASRPPTGPRNSLVTKRS